MGVCMITLVTLLDECDRLPGRSRDAASTLWIFLIEQCMEHLKNDVGVPILVRTADLCRFAKSTFVLPRRHRPIVRIKSAGGSGMPGSGLAGTRDAFIVRLFEDVAGCATEWQDLLTGYVMLESEASDNVSYSLWILGAADICRTAIESIPLPKRLFAIKVPGTWAGMPWALPCEIQTLLTSTWEPKFENIEDKAYFNDSNMACVYQIIGSPSDVPQLQGLGIESTCTPPKRNLCCCLCCRPIHDDDASVPMGVKTVDKNVHDGNMLVEAPKCITDRGKFNSR